MQEDTLQEVRRVMGGQFYGKIYMSVTRLISNPLGNACTFFMQHVLEAILTSLEK